MTRSLSARSKLILLCLALGLVPGACRFTPASVTDEISVQVREVQVWVDDMPGSPAKTHATLRATMTNRTGREIRLSGAEGLIIDAATDAPLRRFPAVLSNGMTDVREIVLAPGVETTVLIHTPMHIAVIDRARTPRAVVAATFETSLGRPLLVNSSPVDIFATH